MISPKVAEILARDDLERTIADPDLGVGELRALNRLALGLTWTPETHAIVLTAARQVLEIMDPLGYAKWRYFFDFKPLGEYLLPRPGECHA